MAFRRMSKSVSSLVRLSKSAHLISPPANSSSLFCNNDPFRIPMAFLLRNSSSYSSPKGDQFKYQQGLNSRKAQSQHPQPQPQTQTQTRNGTTILARLQESFKAEGMPTTALGLGLAGAIPFVLLTPPFCDFMPGTLSANALEAQAAYGAVILSFLGGPHWGLAMVRTHAAPYDKVVFMNISTFRFIWSVIPSLLAWYALLLSPIPKMTVLIASFILACVVDTWCSLSTLLPPWYLPLRGLLTFVVILCLISSTFQAFFVQKSISHANENNA